MRRLWCQIRWSWNDASPASAKEPPRIRAALKMPEASPASSFATDATVAWFRNIIDRIIPTPRRSWVFRKDRSP